MSRNCWEHREDQAAEDQDEPKQKNKEEGRGDNHKYNTDVKWKHWQAHQIKLSKTQFSMLIIEMYNKVELSSRFSYVTNSWTHSGAEGRSSARTIWQHNHRTYFLSAVNHEPNYYSISWDIKLIMLVCATWFARNKQWNCGYWKTSNIRPFPHSDCRSLGQETIAFHLHKHNMLGFFFHHINLPKPHHCLK